MSHHIYVYHGQERRHFFKSGHALYLNHKLGVKCPTNLLSAPVFKGRHIKKDAEDACV